MAKTPVINLQPALLDLALYAGDGANIRLTLTDNATPPAPLNLTGEVLAQIRKVRTDADPLADFAIDITDPANGIVIISLDGTQTAALIPTGETEFEGVWDVQWTATGGVPVTLFQGTATCVLDVTR